MELSEAIEWAGSRRSGVLITIRSDGRPQSSDISYAVADGSFLISVTDDRAKTKNMRRDPRVVLHVTEPSSWSYASFDGTVEMSDVATQADDATCDALCSYYETVNGGPHSDWQEYREAMVRDRRLVARFTPIKVVGQVH